MTIETVETRVDPKRRAVSSNAIEKLAYSIPEAVQASGIGRTLLYQAIKSGELRSVKRGGRRLVPVDALRTWLAA